MLPMAGPTPRSVFPTAMAAAAVPGTPLTERAAVPKRICRKLTARACFTVSRLTRNGGQAHDQATCLRCRLVYFDAGLLPDAGSTECAEYSGHRAAPRFPDADSGANDFFRDQRGSR